MMSLRRTVILAGALLLLPALAAATTQLQLMSARQLGDHAAAVVRGTVRSVGAAWNDKHTKIFTEIVVDAEQTYKGGAAGAVRVLQLGGEVDGVRVTVDGALPWETGEEVLLFLEPCSDDRYQVTGLSQGKLLVEHDPATGRAFVRRPALAGVDLLGDADKTAAGRIDRIPLDRFVREALGEEPARERQ